MQRPEGEAVKHRVHAPHKPYTIYSAGSIHDEFYKDSCLEFFQAIRQRYMLFQKGAQRCSSPGIFRGCFV